MKWTDKNVYWFLIPVSLIVLLDEWLKFLGLQHLPEEGNAVGLQWIDFVIHKNYGVAFDLPFRLEIIIAISLVIGYFLLQTAWKQVHTQPLIAFSALMITLGACGNLFDRIMYGFTVDYILLFWRSAINLSDLVIISGVLLLLMSSRKKTMQEAQHLSHTH